MPPRKTVAAQAKEAAAVAKAAEDEAEASTLESASEDLPAKKARAPNVNWTDDEIQSLLDQLKDAVGRGDTSENGFKGHIWTAIEKSYKDPLKQKKRVMKSKWGRIKGFYKEVKFIREQSGFGWDDIRCVPTAEPTVWAALLKVIASYSLVVLKLMNQKGHPEYA